MKTAVEWLVDQLKIFATEEEMKIIDIAKSIERQQIIEAHGRKLRKSREAVNYEYWYTGEEYYEETFKQEEQ